MAEQKKVVTVTLAQAKNHPERLAGGVIIHDVKTTDKEKMATLKAIKLPTGLKWFHSLAKEGEPYAGCPMVANDRGGKSGKKKGKGKAVNLSVDLVKAWLNGQDLAAAEATVQTMQGEITKRKQAITKRKSWYDKAKAEAKEAGVSIDEYAKAIVAEAEAEADAK